MGTGKKKIDIKRTGEKFSRMTTFSRRRKGLFKKVDEFRFKTGLKVATLVISPTGNPYPHGDIQEVFASLSSSSNAQENITMNSGYDDEVYFGNGNGQDLKGWLDEISVENYDVDKLLHLKKQLLDIKHRILRAEAKSWTLH